MDANSKSTTFALAATLLLAIAANATPESKSKQADSKFSFTYKRETTVWCAKPACGFLEESLLDGDEYQDDPSKMLKQLKDQLKVPVNEENLEEVYRHEYISRLISYAEPNSEDICREVSVREFLKLFTMCDNEKRYKRYADFIKSYAHIKFGPCARKLIKDLKEGLDKTFAQELHKLNELFKVAHGLKHDKLTDEAMYNIVKTIDLTKDKLRVGAMVKVAYKNYWRNISYCRIKPTQHLIDYLDLTFRSFKNFLNHRVNIIQVARGIGAIREEELTPRFLLINEYFRFSAQMDNKESYELIKKKLNDSYKASKSYYLCGL